MTSESIEGNGLLKIDQIAIQQKQEYEIKKEEIEPIRFLLESSFPGYFSERIYYKQIPTLRLLASLENQLIGHVGIIHRSITVDVQSTVIFGIADLCVAKSFRSKGIGALLLNNVEELALKYNIAHILAFGDDARLYASLGYHAYANTKCRFLAIDELRSHSVIEREEPSLFIKSFKKMDFSEKLIDLLGHLF